MGRLADFLGHFGRARADANDHSAWGSFWFDALIMAFSRAIKPGDGIVIDSSYQLMVL